MREAIIHRSAQKLADWHAGATRIDASQPGVIHDVDRCLKETEEEFEEAA